MELTGIFLWFEGDQFGGSDVVWKNNEGSGAAKQFWAEQKQHVLQQWVAQFGRFESQGLQGQADMLIKFADDNVYRLKGHVNIESVDGKKIDVEKLFAYQNQGKMYWWIDVFHGTSNDNGEISNVTNMFTRICSKEEK